MNQTLARLGRSALDLIYPPRCAVCGRGGDFLCDACLARLPAADGRRCPVCWSPLLEPDCRACSEHPLPLERLRAAFRYEGEVRRLIHAFKFGYQSSLAPRLGAALTACWQLHAFAADYVVPVPLTGSRRRERGFNQADLLARELGRGTGVPVLPALRRRSFARAQAQSASAGERRHNVEAAFVADPGVDLAGQRIVLVDDITTTGATLAACTLALLDGGAAAVSALTLARED